MTPQQQRMAAPVISEASWAIRRKRPGDAAESEWDRTIVDYARLMGWWTHHEADSRRGTSGWVDRVFCRPPRLLLVELKVPGGRVRLEQREVLAMLAKCPGIECYVWVLPDAWPEAREVLR